MEMPGDLAEDPDVALGNRKRPSDAVRAKERQSSQGVGFQRFPGFLPSLPIFFAVFAVLPFSNLGGRGCNMERKSWWRFDENAAHNARESWCPSYSILLHNFRSMSHLP